MFDFKQNYFDLFGIPRQFEVDLEGLKAQYRALQKLVHPDRHAHKSEHERRLAMQATSHLNQAFDTLKHPLSRVTYLLSLQGIDLQTETDTRMSPVFLMQQMEWRENLEEIGDKDDPWEALDILTDEVRELRQTTLEKIAGWIGDEHWDKAREGARELQFIEKMLGEIESREAELEEQI